MATQWHAPGYAEALAREQQLREEAYLSNPSVCAGVRIRQITPRLLNLLVVIDSPFVNGGYITPAEAIRFLWTLSSDFNESQRDWFASRYPRHMAKRGWDWDFVFESIAQFIETTFLDAPVGVESTPYVCSTAWLEVRMKKLMDWDSDRTLDTPLRRIYQLLRCDAIMAGDRTLINKLSDKANDEWLKSAMSNPELLAQIQRGGVKLN